MADPTISNLRWYVTIATRNQAPDPTTGITETYVNMTPAYADITPIGLQAWIGSETLGAGITHRVTIRFRDDLDMFDVILRDVVRPDGTTKSEVYRIRRSAPWQGRQRFMILDCELERISNGG